MDADDETVISRVGAWKDKDEFDLVYDWMYGTSATNATKQKALSRMKLWKIRRLNLTPASVLSTMSILDVLLKDTRGSRFAEDELRSMYSNAFTRFMNYMSSIMRSRELLSMYSTARELGIQPFLVDLRHLCAHGQVLPSLEISRRTAAYCMNWLREFYWDRERNVITDATVRDVHLKSSLELEQSIRDWFSLYDAASESMNKGCKTIDDLLSVPRDEGITQTCCNRLHEFAQQHRQSKLSFIVDKAVNQLALLSNSNERDHGDAQIYCDVLFDCENFMKRSAEYYMSIKERRTKFIAIHQNLFRMFAICDFINAIFMRLFMVCEDPLEEEYRKRAASFWIEEIATGFLVFKELKMLYKTKKEKNSKFDIDLAPINTDIMTDDIKQIYKELGVNYRGMLIFGDTVRRPWSLQFDSNFLIERTSNINQYTVRTIKKCIQLVEPALEQTEARFIERLISIYMDQESVKIPEDKSNDKIYTLDDCAHNPKPQLKGKENSIWREAPDGLNWKSCPLGSFPCHHLKK